MYTVNSVVGDEAPVVFLEAWEVIFGCVCASVFDEAGRGDKLPPLC